MATDIEDTLGAGETVKELLERAVPTTPPPLAVEITVSDPAQLEGAIEKVMKGEGLPFTKRRKVAELVLKILNQTGFLCQSNDARLFYFNRPKKKLYDLGQGSFERYLAGLTGLATTEAEFNFVLDKLQTSASQTPPIEIHTLSYFDPVAGRLAVSNGGGELWFRRGGGEWTRGDNGDEGVLFFTEADATAWTPDFISQGSLDWFLSQFLLTEFEPLSREDQQSLLLVWLLHQFFPPMRATRMIVAMLGIQGSGKSTATRLVGRLLCGTAFEVGNVSKQKEDGCIAALANSVIVALDNTDTWIDWLEDLLAVYATGVKVTRRGLYTNNDLINIELRAILMLSSRDPRFKRPDVSERILPLHFAKPQRAVPEKQLFGELMRRRGAIMGELLTLIGRVADSVAKTEAPSFSFRMADFADFGWHVFNAQGKPDEWAKLLNRLERSQASFAGEDDSLIIVLRTLLEKDGGFIKEIGPAGVIGPVTTSRLFELCTDEAKEHSLPMLSSPVAFGRKLTNMKPVIELELGVNFIDKKAHQSVRTVTLIKKGEDDFEKKANGEDGEDKMGGKVSVQGTQQTQQGGNGRVASVADPVQEVSSQPSSPHPIVRRKDKF